MFAHPRRYASAPSRRRSAFHLHPVALAALCLVTLLAGCTVAPPAPVAGNPADPDARGRPTAYRPVIGPYASQRPRDPSDWRQNNERVAPLEKQ